MQRANHNNQPPFDAKSIEGISNVAINVSSIVQFHSVFSQQNKKYSDISLDKIHYHDYFLLKALLTDMSRKIMSRRHSGFTRQMQCKLRRHVLIARFLGLLPYVK